MDSVINRCPLFCDELHTSPDKSLAVDTLHTFNYGPVMWWTSSALWGLILANPWQLSGSSKEHTLELACRRMRADMFEFFERKGIPAARRLGDFTATMIGTPLNCQMGPTALPHPGCGMKTKAAETMIVMDWAIDLLDRYTGIPLHAEMKVAGKALQHLMDSIR